MTANRAIKAWFCDGGLIGRNPSSIGGTWATCGVSADGEHIREVSGYLLTQNTTCPGWPRVGSDIVTNNESEWYAAMKALESMSNGWSGLLVSDSEVTLERLQRLMSGEHLRTFRMDWAGRARSAFNRLGEIKLRHLAGHPTLQEQADGFKTKKDGTVVRVNRHQVWADQECRRLAENWGQHLEGWKQTGLLLETA